MKNFNLNFLKFKKNRDEQNIKRRVYDALNVLIAANVLKKREKIVECDEERNPLDSKLTIEEKKNGICTSLVSKIFQINHLKSGRKEFIIEK